MQAPTVGRKQWPPQTGQLNEMRHRDRASNLQTVKVSCGSLGASSTGSQNGTYPVLGAVHASKTGEHRVGALRAGDPGSLRSSRSLLGAMPSFSTRTETVGANSHAA